MVQLRNDDGSDRRVHMGSSSWSTPLVLSSPWGRLAAGRHLFAMV
jgi:hypothetical protein